MKVKEIMTARVVTVTPGTPVPVIAGLLRGHRISGVPVTGEQGAVTGLVSEYDLLLSALTGAGARRPRHTA
ncbi:MAG TPA: CBS domain-containing protein [Streptosporangiaceae bacterium]|nr:CBS domain-containing protein [Streptosporangiaceae bacterium]